jgi:hypothetical protein
MRRIRLVCLLTVLATNAGAAQAQWGLSCRLNHRRTLLYEPVLAEILIQNNSSRVVHLNRGPDDPVFELRVERAPGQVIREDPPLVFEPPLIVPPREAIRREVNLLEHFDMFSTGPYSVQARLGSADEAVASRRVYLDVIPGLELNSVSGPRSEDGSATRFTLLRAHRELGTHLFMRVTRRPGDRCLGVYDLGRLIALYDPDLQVDVREAVHVLHQSGPATATHSVFSPDGRAVSQEAHVAHGKPQLRETTRGDLVVESRVVAPPPNADSRKP